MHQQACKRPLSVLFDRGIIDQVDGGYLTELGHELQQHALHLSNALK